MLREKGLTELEFYSRDQLRHAFEVTQAFYDKHRVWPWEPETGVFWRVLRSVPGTV